MLPAKIVNFSIYNTSSTICENMRYFMYKYKFITKYWNKPLSSMKNKIDSYVNITVNITVCTATTIKELCEARDNIIHVLCVTHNSLTVRNLLSTMSEALCKKIICMY